MKSLKRQNGDMIISDEEEVGQKLKENKRLKITNENQNEESNDSHLVVDIEAMDPECSNGSVPNDVSKHNNSSVPSSSDNPDNHDLLLNENSSHKDTEAIEEANNLSWIDFAKQKELEGGECSFLENDEPKEVPKYDEESSQSDTDVETSFPPESEDAPEATILTNEKHSNSEKEVISDVVDTEKENEINAEQESVDSQKFTFDIDNLSSSSMSVSPLDGHADLTFSVVADNNLILSSSGDTTIKVWDGNEKKELCSFRGHTDVVTSVVLLSEEQSEILSHKLACKDAKRIALSSSFDCHIKIWSVNEGKELKSIYTFNSITSMDFLEDELLVIIGTDGGKIELWDIINEKSVQTIKNAHEEFVSALKVVKSQVYSTSWDGVVKVWSIDDNELLPMYARRRKEMASNKRDFNPTRWNSVVVHEGILYLADDESNSLKVLDFETARLVLRKNQPEKQGCCKSVYEKDNVLLSSFFDVRSRTGGINVWKLPDMSYVCTLTGPVGEIHSLAMTVTDKKLRIVSGGSEIFLWDFDFTQPYKSDDKFSICELDQIGSELMNESTKSPNKSFSASSSTSSESVASKKTWCSLM